MIFEGDGRDKTSRVQLRLTSVYCIEGKCLKTIGRLQGSNAKRHGKIRRGARHGKVLGKT